MTRPPVVYASNGRGIHDDRWMEALHANGFAPTAVDLDPPTADDLRRAVVLACAGDPTVPVLAGPLGSVTRHLIDLPNPVVGLSWGFDLLGDQATAARVYGWLPMLSGLVVDTRAARLLAERIGLAPARILELPWGTDLDVFRPDGPAVDRGSWGLGSDDVVLLSLRGFDAVYRVDEILEAFAIAASSNAALRLVIGNDGPQRRQLEDHAVRLGVVDRVVFIGRIREVDLPAVLRSVDAYVTASEVDGTSVTLLQAMACGVPVLASASMGNCEWIDESTGRTFPVGDVEALADLMQRVPGSRRAATTAAALERVRRRADWSRNRAQLGALLRSVSPA